MNKIVLDLHQIFKSCVCAVKPENLIKNSLKYDSVTQHLNIAGRDYKLKDKDVSIIGFGKAVLHMAEEVEDILSSKIKQGILSIPIGSYNGKMSSKITYHEGAMNNLPDRNALATANKIKELALKLEENDVLIVLISGGGSALLPLPKPPITLDEKTSLIKNLANSGADIVELNTVRKRISDIKGGQLAVLAKPATVVALILSDIVEDPIDLIASGPTYENKDDPSAALRIIEKYGLYNELPNSIKSNLLVKENALVFPSNNVQNVVIGSNKLSINAGIVEAQKLDYYPIEISNIITGNIKDIAYKYFEIVELVVKHRNGAYENNEFKRELTRLQVPGFDNNHIQGIDIDKIKNSDLCLIFGGETTVEVKGHGKGGRNQELALEFSKLINQYRDEKKHDIFFLSAGTDGIDGPTDVAGAIGYHQLMSDSKQDNIDLESYINNNDSYNFYKAFKNGQLHVITGHTNTNVMDIHLIIIRKCI